MLEDAKVTINLSECDDLRNKAKELNKIKGMISDSVTVREFKNVEAGYKYPKIELIIDPEKIKKLIEKESMQICKFKKGVRKEKTQYTELK